MHQNKQNPIQENKENQQFGSNSHELKGNEESNFVLGRNLRFKKSITDLCCQIAFNRVNFGLEDISSPLPQLLTYNAQMRASSIRNSLKRIPTVKEKKLEQYERVSSYIKEEDWRIDESKGGVILFNKDKKSIISKLIGYICKRVLSTGSFMGISFPTFGMKPQSILQTYCKCLSAVPLIMEGVENDPLARIKAFNAIIASISLQFNDIEKPFNPTIGQTYQGEIGGYNVYAEQICHHPPVSSFMLKGDNYTLHATLELSANLSFNSAVGMFYGDITLEFDDGGVVKGRIPCGSISGMVFGQTRFLPYGAAYSFDPVNKLVSSYYVKSKDIFVGIIGKLLPSSQEKFMKKITEKGRERYEKFENIPQSEFQTVLSKMEIIWSKQVSYDGKVYFDFQQPKNLPIKMTQNIGQSGEQLLKSDSSWRQDIKLRSAMRIEQSQKQKQRIEDEERFFRKLREKSKQ